MKNFSLTGFWKFKSNRIRLEDGSWLNEKIFGGTLAFSETNEACLFVRTDQGSWGYSGKYRLSGDTVQIKVEASIADDIEGTFIERNIHFITSDELILSGIESHTGRAFEANCVRVG